MSRLNLSPIGHRGHKISYTTVIEDHYSKRARPADK